MSFFSAVLDVLILILKTKIPPRLATLLQSQNQAGADFTKSWGVRSGVRKIFDQRWYRWTSLDFIVSVKPGLQTSTPAIASWNLSDIKWCYQRYLRQFRLTLGVSMLIKWIPNLTKKTKVFQSFQWVIAAKTLQHKPTSKAILLNLLNFGLCMIGSPRPMVLVDGNPWNREGSKMIIGWVPVVPKTNHLSYIGVACVMPDMLPNMPSLSHMLVFRRGLSLNYTL